MLIFGRIVQLPVWNEGRARVSWAMLASTLVHLALLLFLANHVSKVHKVKSGEFPTLHGQIVPIHTAAKQQAPNAVHDILDSPISQEQPAIAVSRAEEKPEMTPTVAEDKAPVPTPPEAGGDPAVRFGVTVTETLFQRPLPRQFQNELRSYPGFVRSTELDLRPEPIKLIVPEVRSPLLRSRLMGTVTVAIFIDELGYVVDAVSVQASEGFNDEEQVIVAALRQSTFTPGKLNGQAVKSISFQVLHFGQQPALVPDVSAPVNP